MSRTYPDLLRDLDMAIAEFLDADSAWDEDEISAEDYAATIDALKATMYRVRAEAKALADQSGGPP